MIRESIDSLLGGRARRLTSLFALVTVASVLGCSSRSSEWTESDTLFEQANTQFRAEQYAAAAKTFEECIKVSKRDGMTVEYSVYGLCALSNYKSGKFRKAVADTTIALSIIDRDTESAGTMARLYYQRAMAYLRLDEKKLADEDFKSALKFDPNRSHDPRTK